MKMDLSVGTTMILYAAIFFGAGVGWGQWWAERQLRQETKGRVQVTMPVNPEDAAATLEMLSLMVKKAEMDRKARAQ